MSPRGWAAHVYRAGGQGSLLDLLRRETEGFLPLSRASSFHQEPLLPTQTLSPHLQRPCTNIHATGFPNLAPIRDIRLRKLDIDVFLNFLFFFGRLGGSLG